VLTYADLQFLQDLIPARSSQQALPQPDKDALELPLTLQAQVLGLNRQVGEVIVSRERPVVLVDIQKLQRKRVQRRGDIGGRHHNRRRHVLRPQFRTVLGQPPEQREIHLSKDQHTGGRHAGHVKVGIEDGSVRRQACETVSRQPFDQLRARLQRGLHEIHDLRPTDGVCRCVDQDDIPFVRRADRVGSDPVPETGRRSRRSSRSPDSSHGSITPPLAPDHYTNAHAF